MPLSEAWEIVTTTETEWDDLQRDKMLALTLYRNDLCQQCGFPKVLHDPRYHYAVEFEHCSLRAELDRFGRIQADADEKAKKHIGENPAAPLPSDGRTVATRMKPRAGR